MGAVLSFLDRIPVGDLVLAVVVGLLIPAAGVIGWLAKRAVG